MANQAKGLALEVVADVLDFTREEIVHAHDAEVPRHKRITEIGTDETGSAGDDNRFHIRPTARPVTREPGLGTFSP